MVAVLAIALIALLDVEKRLLRRSRRVAFVGGKKGAGKIIELLSNVCSAN